MKTRSVLNIFGGALVRVLPFGIAGLGPVAAYEVYKNENDRVAECASALSDHTDFATRLPDECQGQGHFQSTYRAIGGDVVRGYELPSADRYLEDNLPNEAMVYTFFTAGALIAGYILYLLSDE